MSASGRCVSRARSAVIWGSFVLALAGWAGSLWSYIDHGYSAGVNPGFITALSVAITFTITCCQTVVMPDKARMYAIGFRDGVKAREELERDPEPSRLTVVR